MKIYTRTGDKGETSLGTGTRVRKNTNIIEAIGSLDELSAELGLAAYYCDSTSKELIKGLQVFLYLIMGEISNPRKENKYNEEIKLMENQIDIMESKLVPLRNFILPGGSLASCFLHRSRTVCRNCERCLCDLEINSEILAFINRLSDLLFVMARYQNMLEGVDDVIVKR